MSISKLLGGAVIAFALSSTASAAELITNGTFETGTYAGWNNAVQTGSSGNLYISSGTVSPQSGFAVAVNTSGGTFYSITDQSGPGSYALTQSFTLTRAGSIRISFQMFTNTTAGIFNNGRDFNTNPNQNAEVNILTGTANVFTNAGADIVSTLFGPGATTGGQPQPWTDYAFDRVLGAGTYQLRFAQTDNQGFFQQGVDNVSVTAATVPEPASWMMLIAGFGLVGAAARRRTAVAA